tara:strand:- start:279 stop:554 length:276 start_codon:yes stop_codon:yes gene_type:complete
MANFNQITNPVNFQNTAKLSKSVLKAIKIIASNTKIDKPTRIDLIKLYKGVKTAVEQPNNELMVVSDGELTTRYFINFPTTAHSNTNFVIS